MVLRHFVGKHVTNSRKSSYSGVSGEDGLDFDDRGQSDGGAAGSKTKQLEPRDSAVVMCSVGASDNSNGWAGDNAAVRPATAMELGVGAEGEDHAAAAETV